MGAIKYIFLISFIIPSIIAGAQDHKIAVGFTGSVDISTLDFDLYDTDSPFSPGNEKRTNPGYSYGMRIQYNFNDLLFLRTGLFYATKVFSYQYHYIFNDPEDPFIPKESRLRVYHLGVPLMLGHHVVNKEKFKLSPSAGFVGEFYSGQQETTTFEDNSEEETDFLNQHLNHLLSAQINIGLEYHFSSRFYLTAEPYAKVGMNVPADSAKENKLNAWGGILSLNCNL